MLLNRVIGMKNLTLPAIGAGKSFNTLEYNINYIDRLSVTPDEGDSYVYKGHVHIPCY